MKIIQEEGLQNKLYGSQGYADPKNREVFIDSSLETREKSLVAIHEVLEIWLGKRIKHSKIDMIAIDIIDVMMQLGELK